MFLYTFLLIASLIAALVVFWVYRAIAYNAKSVYKTVLTGTENGLTSDLKADATLTVDSESNSPWGWQGHESPENAAKTHAALPTEKPHWDWSGNQNKIHEHHPHHGGSVVSKQAKTPKPDVGRLHREEKLEFAGKAYKVTRKVNPGILDTETAGKPWGW